MAEDVITKIRIGGNLIGIAGLEAVITETAEQFGDKPDQEIREILMDRLSVRNYIPGRARDMYSRAFWDAFRKYRGEPGEETAGGGIHVAVLGPGCAQCSQLEIDVREVMADMNLAGELFHVTDFREIEQYGILGVPALVINEKVCSVGTMPHRKQIRQWLTEALSERNA
jgi:Thioredoxin domain